MSKIHEVVIVGSGPAGYTAAIYAARANLKPVLFTSSVNVGGELMNTTAVENFPGFPEGILGPNLMDNLQNQAKNFGTEIVFEDVESLQLKGEVKQIVLGNGEVVQALAVIIATGSVYRHLGVENEKRLSGHGVSWCATCDGFFFKDKNIVVVGGGDSAMEEALFLTKFAKKVVVVHRRDNLRASKIMQQRAFANEKISFIWNSEIVEICGLKKLESVVVRDLVTKVENVLNISGLFVAIGNDPCTDLVKGQLDLTDFGTIAVLGRSSRTSLPGVFAAGDVMDPVYRQAVTAAASGCVAAIDVENFLLEK